MHYTLLTVIIITHRVHFRCTLGYYLMHPRIHAVAINRRVHIGCALGYAHHRYHHS